MFGTGSRQPVDCPKCHLQLGPTDVELPGKVVAVEACPRCHGMWLDGGELRKALGDRKLADHLTRDIGTKTDSPLVCPRCGGLMDHEHAGDVEVDVCLDCRGVWLDAGELADLQQLSDAGFEGDPAYKAAERLEEVQAARGRTLLERFTRWMQRPPGS